MDLEGLVSRPGTHQLQTHPNCCLAQCLSPPQINCRSLFNTPRSLSQSSPISSLVQSNINLTLWDSHAYLRHLSKLILISSYSHQGHPSYNQLQPRSLSSQVQLNPLFQVDHISPHLSFPPVKNLCKTFPKLLLTGQDKLEFAQVVIKGFFPSSMIFIPPPAFQWLLQQNQSRILLSQLPTHVQLYRQSRSFHWMTGSVSSRNTKS